MCEQSSQFCENQIHVKMLYVWTITLSLTKARVCFDRRNCKSNVWYLSNCLLKWKASFEKLLSRDLVILKTGSASQAFVRGTPNSALWTWVPLLYPDSLPVCMDRAVGFRSEKGNWLWSVRYQMVLGSMSASGAVFVEQQRSGGSATPASVSTVL